MSWGAHGTAAHISALGTNGVVRDAAAHAMEDAYLFRHFRERECRPFALLTRDLDSSISRLDLVEQALSLPGRQAMLPLYRLKRDARCTNSTLAA